MANTDLRRATGALSLAHWAASLAAPAAAACGRDPERGLALLVAGWLGPLNFQFAWFANPLILISAALLLARRRAWFWVTGLAFLLSLDALALVETYNDLGPVKICRWDLGFYLWLIAAALPFAQALWEIALAPSPAP